MRFYFASLVLVPFIYTESANHSNKIASFYDDLTPIWEDVWGDHLHHGFYDNSGTDPQIRMMEKTLEWVKQTPFKNPRNILDAGCGLGSSSRYLSKQYPTTLITAVSLSPYQIGRAQQLTSSPNIRYYTKDVTRLPYSWNHKFDLIWSLESAEHFPNKTQFIEEAHRLLKPNGKLVIVTWCTKNPNPSRITQFMLSIINYGFHTAAWTSRQEYYQLLKKHNFRSMRDQVWTKDVLPFWRHVIMTAINPYNFFRLASYGPSSLVSSIMLYMGYLTGTIEFAIMTATKI